MTGATLERIVSRLWDEGPTPRIAVLVCTFRRPEYLGDLVAALESQALEPAEFEVIIVDDASGDGSWERLEALTNDTSLRMLALRHDVNMGPAAGRNHAAAHARAPLLAFTDDDCLPTEAWLPSLLRVFADETVDVVQGQVVPHPDEMATAGPWDHTVWVTEPSPFFETCNVAYRRVVYERAGGFDAHDLFLRAGRGDRHFGEDADLAWRVLATGAGSAFAHDALVHHRCVPRTYREWLCLLRHARRFPGLVRRSPLVRRWLRGGLFLTSRSAAFDAAIAGGVAAVLCRRPWPLLATVPWMRTRWGDALSRTRGDRSAAVVTLGQLALSDLVQLTALAEGSIRYRRLVL